jgi:raffinose/stachyose/melibiose transport system substrate-binding protein
MYVKKIAAVLVVLLAVAGMVFAGGGGDSSSSSKVTLKILGYGDNSNAEGQTLQQIIKDFQAANPNITVQAEILYDEAYHQKVRARLAANDVPDVAYMWPTARGQAWKDAGQFIDMRKYIDTNVFDVAKFGQQSATGEIYEVPLGTGNICAVLFMNTELLKANGLAEPKTYADLVAMVAPLKAKGIDVISFAGADGWPWGSCLLSMVIGRVSGEVDWVQKAVAGQRKFTDAAFVNTLKFVETMLKDGVLPSTTVLTDYGTSISNFVNGKSLFTLDGQWRAGAIEDPAFQAKVKMIPFPAIPGEKLSMTSAAAPSVGYGITKKGASDANVAAAAKKFIEFFYSEKNTIQRLRDGAIVAPVLKKYTLPNDLPTIVKEKIRFVGTVSQNTDVIDDWLTAAKGNDALLAGMQQIALGQSTPEKVAAEVEAAARK